MDWISTRSVCCEIRSEHETFEYGWDETRDKKFDSFLKGEGILSLRTSEYSGVISEFEFNFKI